MSPNGGSARMPQAADPGVGDIPAADKTEQILAAVQGMQNQLTGVVKRVAKLEAPGGLSASAGKAARGRTVFFSEEDSEEDEEYEPKLPIQPPQPMRKGTRDFEVKESMDGKVFVYVDDVDAAVGGGGRGLAGLEKACRMWLQRGFAAGRLSSRSARTSRKSRVAAACSRTSSSTRMSSTIVWR